MSYEVKLHILLLLFALIGITSLFASSIHRNTEMYREKFRKIRFGAKEIKVYEEADLCPTLAVIQRWRGRHHIIASNRSDGGVTGSSRSWLPRRLAQVLSLGRTASWAIADWLVNQIHKLRPI